MNTATVNGTGARRSTRTSAPSLKSRNVPDSESTTEKAQALAIRQQGKKRAYGDAEIMAFNASHPLSDDEQATSPTLDNTNFYPPKRSRVSEPSYSNSPPTGANLPLTHLAGGDQTNIEHTHNHSNSGSAPEEPRQSFVTQPQHTTYASLPTRLLPPQQRQFTPSRHSSPALQSISSPQGQSLTSRRSSTPFQAQPLPHAASPSPALSLNRQHSNQPGLPLTPPPVNTGLSADTTHYSSPPCSPEQVVFLVITPQSGTRLQQKRAVANSKRGKHAGYGAIEQMILTSAGSYIVTRITNTNPLPIRDDLVLSAEDAWNWACQHLGHKIKHTKELLGLVKVNVYNNRTLLQAACQAGVTAYGFQLASTGPESDMIAHNKQLHNMLLDRHSFTYQSPRSRNGPYLSPVIVYAYSHTWFRSSNDTGVTHQELWLPVKIEALALVATLVEKGIKGYATGHLKVVNFDVNIIRTRYHFFLEKIEHFSKQLSNAGLPSEFLEHAEIAARSKAGLPLADPVVSQDSNDSEDIACYISSRQAQTPGDNTPSSSSSQQEAPNNYPTGRILVESTQDSNPFRPTGRVLVQSTQDSNDFRPTGQVLVQATQDSNVFGDGDDGSFLGSLANNGDVGHEFFNGFDGNLLPSQIDETQYGHRYAANSAW
ncbi:hypothetical protein BDV93DRAFT_559430 [Ceratobasidium sp. AG-I]|nr:hypothetical protein BDV93DRAFT_559430 [Ceratobasidium sp. AG-I]